MPPESVSERASETDRQTDRQTERQILSVARERGRKFRIKGLGRGFTVEGSGFKLALS